MDNDKKSLFPSEKQDSFHGCNTNGSIFQYEVYIIIMQYCVLKLTKRFYSSFECQRDSRIPKISFISQSTSGGAS